MVSFALLVWMQQVRIEGVFPRQLERGKTTLINVAVPSRETIQGAEISPSAGVKVSAIRRGDNFQGTLSWSEITIDVANDAAPGDRTLVLLFATGRTIPARITIPNHVPSISDLHVLPTQPLAVEFNAVDASADLGDSPYVWFMLGCGGEVIPGVVRGTVTKGVIRAVVPPRPSAANAKCELQVRLSDSSGIESNTLKTTIDSKN